MGDLARRWREAVAASECADVSLMAARRQLERLQMSGAGEFALEGARRDVRRREDEAEYWRRILITIEDGE